LKEQKRSASSKHSSPEFGKESPAKDMPNTLDYQSIIVEIEKRKESLNTIQSMLGVGTLKSQVNASQSMTSV
jgi:hypothetical protein